MGLKQQQSCSRRHYFDLTPLSLHCWSTALFRPLFLSHRFLQDLATVDRLPPKGQKEWKTPLSLSLSNPHRTELLLMRSRQRNHASIPLYYSSQPNRAERTAAAATAHVTVPSLNYCNATDRCYTCVHHTTERKRGYHTTPVAAQHLSLSLPPVWDPVFSVWCGGGGSRLFGTICWKRSR